MCQRSAGRRPSVRQTKCGSYGAPAEVEDVVVRARKELADAGEFNGPFSIADRLAAEGVLPLPSRATIARILSRRGPVRPQPRPLPSQVQIHRTHVGTGGTVTSAAREPAEAPGTIRRTTPSHSTPPPAQATVLSAMS
jgi:hypothetical protein